MAGGSGKLAPPKGGGLAIHPEFETQRLVLRRLRLDDAAFIVELLNQPSFIKNIGDRGVRSIEDAHAYLRDGPMAMYEQFGLGLLHVARKSDGAAVGMCGLLRRDVLPDVDLGYAFLPEYWGSGFAFEAAQGTLRHAGGKLRLKRVIGVVSVGNAASIRVLEKLGMRFERMHAMYPDEPEVCLYGVELTSTGA
jgi:[ribosomal protein S5]-alanine N-acetyltransferase